MATANREICIVETRIMVDSFHVVRRLDTQGTWGTVFTYYIY